MEKAYVLRDREAGNIIEEIRGLQAAGGGYLTNTKKPTGRTEHTPQTFMKLLSIQNLGKCKPETINLCGRLTWEKQQHI